jgi:hypothetical protein
VPDSGGGVARTCEWGSEGGWAYVCGFSTWGPAHTHESRTNPTAHLHAKPGIVPIWRHKAEGAREVAAAKRVDRELVVLEGPAGTGE